MASKSLEVEGALAVLVVEVDVVAVVVGVVVVVVLVSEINIIVIRYQKSFMGLQRPSRESSSLLLLLVVTETMVRWSDGLMARRPEKA